MFVFYLPMATVINCAASFASRGSLDEVLGEFEKDVNKFDEVVCLCVVAACTQPKQAY